MTSENTTNTEDDTLAQLARIIYEEMNVEPRRMNVAIELAKQHLAHIREALIKQNLRSRAPLESSDQP
jgi:hypothetical protein